MPTIGQYSMEEATTSGHDLAGDLNKTSQEAFEFHPQDIAACRRFQSYQSVPGFQIPGQCRNNHLRPIRHQSIRQHSQGVDSALELTDDVLLIAAVVGEENDLLHSHLVVIGDVEKIPLIPRSE